ncbi:DNA topoisomerase [Lactarius hatsudake]|nr:DNA topoisomerase [Lactarius hatsudake]
MACTNFLRLEALQRRRATGALPYARALRRRCRRMRRAASWHAAPRGARDNACAARTYTLFKNFLAVSASARITHLVLPHFVGVSPAAHVVPPNAASHPTTYVCASEYGRGAGGTRAGSGPSQTKETMMLLSSKFGSKSTLSGEFMEEGEAYVQVVYCRERVELGRFQGRTADQEQAVQNATGAHGGLSIVRRGYFGVFPLRGRLLNVREVKHDQIMKNEEIQNIKKMGLQHNKDYSDVGSLQYGQLMIMTDQRLSSQRCQWAWAPCVGNGVEDDRAQATFLEQPAFTRSQTPIVQVTKGKQRIDFFTILKYEQLPEQMPDAHKWNSKYYKGLGMSKDSDTHDYSHDRIYGSIWLDAMGSANSSISHLARKRRTIPVAYFDHNTDEISYSDFINKELRVSRWLRVLARFRPIPPVAVASSL